MVERVQGHMKRIVVGISGASGVIYGIRLLKVLKETEWETHLVISEAAKQNILLETPLTVKEVEDLADKVYDPKNQAAAISSGSYKTSGMVIVPCAIKTLSGVAHSFNENLLIRAADVTLKERRRLILVVRETPLHKGHLALMQKVADLGGIILPPVPAFYINPKSIDDLIDHTIGKILDIMEIDHNLYTRWEGEERPKKAPKRN
jgi:4-hydroxy-3-polyprenylbenzoate decarboxylase